MAKIELPNPGPDPAKDLSPLEAEKPSRIKQFFGGVLTKTFDILKFIFGILLLPFVYSCTVSFLTQMTVIDKPLQRYFWSGVITFLVVYLFILEPVKVYTKGQKILEAVFSFFKPLVRVAPYLLPIYALLLFGIYSIVSIFSKDCLGYFLFLFGMALCLHLVFSSRSLRSKQGGFLKGNYIFAFSFIYIINIAIATSCLNILFERISFVGFCNNSFQSVKGIFSAIFKQLFVV
ncbi:MAG: hypothetical protein NTU54_04530 [Candidatus Omnitrophica bacterium]|nr:hypothetical protein [Candidatus Omnitrophota bacterium]